MITAQNVKTYSVRKRRSKVRAQDFAQPPRRGKSCGAFLKGLPDILKAADLRAVVGALLEARRRGKARIFMAGAHVIKCGLNPVVIELMRQGFISCVCLNGAGVIHDFEIAFQAQTSEDVAENLLNGSFGMGRETADFLNRAVSDGAARGQGFGQAVCAAMVRAHLPHRQASLLCQAAQLSIPVFVFVTIGADIIHQHPSFDGAAVGAACARDFSSFAAQVRLLHRGGVALNFGSAVVLPEVFLKALNITRNVAGPVTHFTTANFDMIQQYRPFQNVVTRPVQGGGNGYTFTGHHEIMLPLLAQALIDEGALRR